jgi:arginase family enzyme
MLDAFFTPIDESIWAPHRDRNETVGGKLLVHGKSFPKLKKVKLALIGAGAAADAFRKSMYKLQWRFGDLVMADLGNLVETEDETQRQFALSEAMGELLGMGIQVVVVGGGSSLMYGHYKAYRQHDTPVEIVQVTPGIDMEEGTPLRSILVEKPSNLFNIDFLGTQAYYISESTAALLEKMYFENHRLGEVRDAIEETEPILRSAHMLQFDMNAIRKCDAPSTILGSPNGLYAEEAARIARYAGISNQLSSAFFYGLKSEDQDEATVDLLAQMVWYFVDGFTSRYHDHPTHDSTDFLIYRNRLSSTGHEIVFYKSRKSNRWWMEIPHPYDKRTFFIGCSYRDYEQVCADEMPDRWWRAYQRLM